MAKTVTIRRKQTGIDNQPEQIKQKAKVKLSSMFKNGRPITGFSLDNDSDNETERVMPRVIDADANDPKFYDKVSTFWQELSVNIPHDGLQLDIGKRPDDIPVNPRDYCIYKFAEAHPLVAPNKEQAEMYPNMKFWIERPEEVLQKQKNELDYETQAWTKFIEMQEDEDMIDLMLRVFGGVKPTGTLSEKVITLREKMTNDFKKFVETAEDSNLKVQDFVYQLLEHGIVRKVGNQILYGDEIIGSTMEDAVMELQNKRNSSLKSQLKAELKSRQ